jgi:hypothetical protein
LKFEITAAVNTDQLSNRMQELQQRKTALLLIANPHAEEEAAAPLGGQFLGMESRTRGQDAALEKARKAADFAKGIQNRGFTERGENRVKTCTERGEYDDSDYEDSHHLEKTAALTDRQWLSALCSYQIDSCVQKMVDPDPADVVLFDDHDEVMVRPKSQHFGLLCCFNNFRSFMRMLRNVNIPMHHTLQQVLDKIKELDDNEEKLATEKHDSPLESILGLYNRVITQYFASTERLLIGSIPGGVYAIKYRDMHTDTWADAVVLAHMFGIRLIAMQATDAVTVKWNVRVDR